MLGTSVYMRSPGHSVSLKSRCPTVRGTVMTVPAAYFELPADVRVTVPPGSKPFWSAFQATTEATAAVASALGAVVWKSPRVETPKDWALNPAACAPWVFPVRLPVLPS